MDEYSYHTIGEPATAVFKDRGSKFLAYAFPVGTTEEFKQRLQEIKKEHPRATHHCFAYRIGPGGLLFRAGDAGEPAGSAGKPILGQIDRLGIKDVLVIVVRYFGGTLLGIPGLINAYKSAAALALQMTPVITKNVEKQYRISFDYTVMNTVMQVIRYYDCTVLRQEARLFCITEAGIPLAQAEACLGKLKAIDNVEVQEI